MAAGRKGAQARKAKQEERLQAELRKIKESMHPDSSEALSETTTPPPLSVRPVEEPPVVKQPVSRARQAKAVYPLGFPGQSLVWLSLLSFMAAHFPPGG